MAVAAACAVVALLVPVVPIRVLAALPLALFLPGFALAAAIFPGAEAGRRQRLVLCLGLSLIVLALGSLLLDVAPGGIRSGWWALLLFLVVLGGCRGAALRRSSPPRGSILPRRPRLRMANAALLSLGALGTVAALVLAFVPLGAKHAEGYTEMWIRPLGGASKTGVEIGVGSREQHPTGYSLKIRVGGAPLGGRREFSLRPGQSKTLGFSTPASGGGSVPVSATLFKDGEAGAYRRVSTWIVPPGEA